MQTRSMTERASTTSKLFEFPLIDYIERKIRKQRKEMDRLSKSATMTNNIIENESSTTTITLPSTSRLPERARTPPPPPAERARTPPPPLVDRPRTPSLFVRAITPPPPLPPQETIANKMRSFAFKFFWVTLQLLILTCAAIKIYEFFMEFRADDDNDVEEDRFQFIVFDKKSGTYKISN